MLFGLNVGVVGGKWYGFGKGSWENETISQMKFSRDGEYLAIGGCDGDVRIYRLKDIME